MICQELPCCVPQEKERNSFPVLRVLAFIISNTLRTSCLESSRCYFVNKKMTPISKDQLHPNSLFPIFSRTNWETNLRSLVLAFLNFDRKNSSTTCSLIALHDSKSCAVRILSFRMSHIYFYCVSNLKARLWVLRALVEKRWFICHWKQRVNSKNRQFLFVTIQIVLHRPSS